MLDAAEVARLEVANGFLQFDLVIDVIEWHVHPERPFKLQPGLIRELQKVAVQGIEPNAGDFRSTSVGINKSNHVPPPAHLVQSYVVELCDYVNNNWHEQTAFHLSAYVLWRLNWIHPFTDGNGRTARAVSYVVLCLKLGYKLPGLTKTIPAQIETDKSYYFRALESADAAEARGRIDVSEMEQMLKGMLAVQLLEIIEAAGGRPIDTEA